LEYIRKAGHIKSNSSLALPIEKHLGLTPFASTIDETAMYGGLNKSGGGNSYVLEVNRTPDMRGDYTSLPAAVKKRTELLDENRSLEVTAAKPGPDQHKYVDWLAQNRAELSQIEARLQESGIEEGLLASAPSGANLPYWMTPRPVPASNIQRVLRGRQDGTMEDVSHLLKRK
jgi:hypothetical protein